MYDVIKDVEALLGLPYQAVLCDTIRQDCDRVADGERFIDKRQQKGVRALFVALFVAQFGGIFFSSR